MELEIYRLLLEKYSNTKFHKNPVTESRVVPCGRTGGHEKVNSRFSEFFERAYRLCLKSHANAPIDCVLESRERAYRLFLRVTRTRLSTVS